MSIYGQNYHASYFKKSGETAVFGIIKEMLGSDILYFDVGACDGEYSKTLLNYFGDNSLGYAFEPKKSNFNLLVDNIGYKKLNIQLFNVGFGRLRENRWMYSVSDIDTSATLYSQGLKANNICREKIKLTSIDIFIVEHDIHHIDFLKLDCEGHEFSILQGAEKCLSEGRIKIIQFEFGEFNIHSRTYFRDFWEYLHENYRIYKILNNGIGEIDRYTVDLELFYTSNYLAIMRGI